VGEIDQIIQDDHLSSCYNCIWLGSEEMCDYGNSYDNDQVLYACKNWEGSCEIKQPRITVVRERKSCPKCGDTLYGSQCKTCAPDVWSRQRWTKQREKTD